MRLVALQLVIWLAMGFGAVAVSMAITVLTAEDKSANRRSTRILAGLTIAVFCCAILWLAAQ